MIRIHSHSPLIIIGLTAYYLIRKVSDGDTSSSVCKYTKILNTSKQNTRKIAQMKRKSQTPRRRQILFRGVWRLLPRTRPLPCASLPYGLHLGVLAWYILRKNKKHAGPLMVRAYLFNRATGGAVASLPWGRALGGWCLFGSFSLRQSARLCRLLPKGRKKWTITEDASWVELPGTCPRLLS